MSAWSALVLDNLNGLESMTKNKVDMNILQEGKTWNGLRYYVCRELSWDYVTEIGKFYLSHFICFCLLKPNFDFKPSWFKNKDN